MFRQTLCILLASMMLNPNGCGTKKPASQTPNNPPRVEYEQQGVEKIPTHNIKTAILKDFDHDGDIDAEVTNRDGTTYIYQNQGDLFYRSKQPVDSSLF